MDTKTTYLLCPDQTCDLFWDISRPCPCERDCPQQEKLVKIIKYIGCGELIELPGDHFSWRRVDHNCPDGRRVMNLQQRMTGRYRLLYERPK